MWILEAWVLEEAVPMTIKASGRMILRLDLARRVSSIGRAGRQSLAEEEIVRNKFLTPTLV